jgi:hypothetical protein
MLSLNHIASALMNKCSLFSKIFGDINTLKKQYESIFVRKAIEALKNEILCDDEKDCFGHGVCSMMNNQKTCQCSTGYDGFFCTWTSKMYKKITKWVDNVLKILSKIGDKKEDIIPVITAISDTSILIDVLP